MKKYNPLLWICKDENSKKNAIYEVVTDEEYKRMQQDSDMEYSDEECILPSCSSSDSTSPITIENPYADKEIDETEGVENFDRSILLKAVNLSTYSIDPDYVSPEERVMKKILSSENKEQAATEFIIGRRKQFIKNMKPKFMKKGFDVNTPFEPLKE